MFISGAGESDVYAVMARTGKKGTSHFVCTLFLIVPIFSVYIIVFPFIYNYVEKLTYKKHKTFCIHRSKRYHMFLS